MKIFNFRVKPIFAVYSILLYSLVCFFKLAFNLKIYSPIFFYYIPLIYFIMFVFVDNIFLNYLNEDIEELKDEKDNKNK